MPATGTKDGPRTKGSPSARAGLAVAGAVVVAAAAVGLGLWAASGTPDEPYPDDVHATAPGCGQVPEGDVEALLGEALHETDTTGPLHGGEHTACTWITRDGDGVLRVELSVRFTDPSGDPLVTGDERTAEFLGAVVPEQAEETDLAGGHAQVWPGHASGTVELAHQADNLLVRVSYTGPSEGGPSEDELVDLAARIGEAL